MAAARVPLMRRGLLSLGRVPLATRQTLSLRVAASDAIVVAAKEAAAVMAREAIVASISATMPSTEPL
jgi:hypothetical protein